MTRFPAACTRFLPACSGSSRVEQVGQAVPPVFPPRKITSFEARWDRHSACRDFRHRLLATCLIALSAGAIHAQQMTPDRMVAEWAVRMGGSVVLEGQRRPISTLSELPASDFQIHTLNLVGVTTSAYGLKDELSRLPALPQLKELYLNGRLWYGQPIDMVTETLAYFEPAKGLEKLVLSKPVQTYIPIEDPVIKEIGSLTSLQELRLHQTRIPGDSLAPFTRLKYLDLSYNRFFNDKGMRHLASMRDLSKLYLRATSVTDAGLKDIAGLTELTELDLAGVGISDTGLSYLSGLTKLRRLDLQGSNVTDAGIDALRGMTNLEELSLYRTKVSNAGLAKLGSLKKLQQLDLRYSRATSAGVNELVAGLPNCKVEFQDSSNRPSKLRTDVAAVKGKGDEAIAAWLRSIGGKVSLRDGHVVGVSLQSTSITDRELEILPELKQIEDLNLRDTEVSDVGAAYLSRLRSLWKLDLSYTLLSDKSLDKLAPLENLRTLLMSNTLVEGPGLAAIAGLTKLEELNFDNSPLKNTGAQHLGKLVGLKRLSLKYTDITDRGAPSLAALKNLTHLDLAGVDITDSGLESLAGLTQLEDLNLSFCRFSDAGLKFLTGLQKLKNLSMAQTRVSDAGMEFVAKLEKLESLDLNYTTVGDSGLAKLSSLGALAELRLDHAEVTDAALKAVAGWRSLRQIDLYHTYVTEKGIQGLNTALPNCHIDWDRNSGRRDRRS